MKLIKTVDAVGHILCQDITKIVKDEFKGVAFKKGHVVRQEDIETLLDIGKENLYIWEKKEGMLHENEGAEILASICENDNMTRSEIKEGKIDLFASIDGLLKVNVQKLYEINLIDEVMIATRHTNQPVKNGDILAGTRVIPLVISEERMKEVVNTCSNEKILEIKPYKHFKLGIVTTGSEVYNGRIKDTFTPVIVEKLSKYNVEIIGHETVTDDVDMIKTAISNLKNHGATLIVCTGGMSVDPDDVTPTAIKESGAEIVSYGAPVLPGAMFLLGYFDDKTPIMGLPGCVMYSKATVFDLVLPRILVGEVLSNQDLAKYSHGGLCLKCKECSFPHCEFGKGA